MKIEKFIKHILISTVFIAITAFMLQAQTSAQVLEQQKSFAEAIVKADWKTLEKFCHKDLIYTHSFGRVDTKEDFLRNISKLKIEMWDNESPSVSIYKNTAIIHSNLKVKIYTPDGEVQSSQQRATDVWLFEKKKWRLVSHQSTSFK
jgi:ketosteroid isomerase-like protein